MDLSKVPLLQTLHLFQFYTRKFSELFHGMRSGRDGKKSLNVKLSDSIWGGGASLYAKASSDFIAYF